MKQPKESTLLATDVSSILFYRQRWALGALVLAVMAFLLAPWSLYDKLWGIAYGICPQRPGHSLFFG